MNPEPRRNAHDDVRAVGGATASTEPTPQEVAELYRRMDREAEEGGYHLNPDVEFTKELVRGIIVNMRRYGYGNCPCRIASGDRQGDQDIICPCDYRDADVVEYGTCY